MIYHNLIISTLLGSIMQFCEGDSHQALDSFRVGHVMHPLHHPNGNDPGLTCVKKTEKVVLQKGKACLLKKCRRNT